MMRFTKYAKPEVLAFSLGLSGDIAAIVLVGMIVSVPAGIIVGLLTLPVSVFLLSFFRDPVRRADVENIPVNQMVSPADGKITEITEYDEPLLGGSAIKIGIFLSIFNVHINRFPCEGKVLEVTHTPGEFLNAMNPESSKRNERNQLIIEPKGDMIRQIPKKIIVRQIAGLIAKRIVCEAGVGDTLKSGEQFGMIKFGSRTELIVPAEPKPNIRVEVGQKVCAGNDVLLTY